jgi:hypothetical protein
MTSTVSLVPATQPNLSRTDRLEIAAVDLSDALGRPLHGNDHSEPVFVRVASRPPGDGCVIHLGDCRRRAVEISASGWQLVDHSGVNFWRPSGLRALPEPARGGAIDEILEFVNIEPADAPLCLPSNPRPAAGPGPPSPFPGCSSA